MTREGLTWRLVDIETGLTVAEGRRQSVSDAGDGVDGDEWVLPGLVDLH